MDLSDRPVFQAWNIPAQQDLVPAPGKPTGQVQNASNGFIIQNGTKASWHLSTEDGRIQAWNTGTSLRSMVDNSRLAASLQRARHQSIGHCAFASTRRTFHSGTVCFPTPLSRRRRSWWGFTDPNLPAGCAPFKHWNLKQQSST